MPDPPGARDALTFALEQAEIDPARGAIEVVERKGRGHPDTLCDTAAEAFSRRLCRAYLEEAGHVLHHNVDKALLVGGQTRAGFGGGEWTLPIRWILAGRATECARGVEEIGRAAVAEALREVRHLDPAHVETEIAVRPGSVDLRTLFGEARPEAPRSNDTSIGVGFAPLSRTERLALSLDKRLFDLMRSEQGCPFGEDTKVMAVRSAGSVRLTVAVAMIAGLVPDVAAYREALVRVDTIARDEAEKLGFDDALVFVNAADDEATDSFYLTLSGTSAECGDDGQVGRGNRVSGLITPARPMTLEAFAGKNPRTHVGKLLSLAAGEAAEACARLEGVRAAECLLVSRIGAPVSEPQGAHVRLDAAAEAMAPLREPVREIVDAACARIPDLWKELVGPSPG